jgi:hypothetical protein
MDVGGYMGGLQPGPLLEESPQPPYAPCAGGSQRFDWGVAELGLRGFDRLVRGGFDPT